MPVIQWDQEQYGFGVEELDRHHRELVSIVNDFHDSMKSGRASLDIGRKLEELEIFASEHFEREEELLEERNYDRLQRQMEQHRRFAETVEKYQRRLGDGSMTLTMDLITFLQSWLENHLNEAPGGESEARDPLEA